MKKITLLKSLLVVMALSLFSFSAVAEEVTYTYTPSEHLGSATTNLTTNEYVMNADLAFTADKGGTTNNVAYNKDGELRLYANKSDGNGCSLTLKPKNGVTITKIVLNATGASYTPTVKYSVDGGDEIEGSWSSTAMTISGISAKTSFKFRNAFIGDTNKQLRLKNIVVTYTTSSEGGGSGNEGGEEGGGDVVEPEPEEPTSSVEYVDEQGRIVYPFANALGFNSWGSSYAEHVVEYNDATVTFEKANKQNAGNTIDDIPVTKRNYVQLELKDATKAITSVRLVCRQWGSKAQTITLNAGTSVAGLTNTNITSSNFVLETNELPINSSVIRFTFSEDNQIGIDSIYYAVADKVAVAIEQPTVSEVGGEKYEAFDVKLACATEGAIVYYTLNGGEKTEYTTPINISENTELKTWAELDENVSDEIVVNYTFPAEVADIAALIADETGKNVRIAATLTVIAQTGKYLWVKDASASMLVYATATAPAEYNNGDQLIGLVGKVSTYSGAKQITPVYFPAAVAGTPVEPTVMALADVTAEKVHQYIKLEKVIYLDEDKLGDSGSTLTMYNRFNFTYDGEAEDEVNVVAIVGLYNGNVQVYPISIEKVVTGGPTTAVDVIEKANIYTENGMIMAEGEFQIFTVTGQNVTDMNGNLENGVYVVRSANAVGKVVVK